MIKQALKEALLDLKSQMRGRRAKSYLKSEKKEEKEDKEEGAKHEAAEAQDDKSKPNLVPKGAGKAGEMVKDSMDDFKEQMKGFMSKKRKGKSSGRPIVALKASFPVAAAPKKGKGK